MHSQDAALTKQFTCIERGEAYLSLFLNFFLSHNLFDNDVIISQSHAGLMRTDGGGVATAFFPFSQYLFPFFSLYCHCPSILTPTLMDILQLYNIFVERLLSLQKERLLGCFLRYSCICIV